MTIIRICEKWTINADDSDRDAGDEWFLDWVIRSPSGAGKHMVSCQKTLEDLSRILYPGEVFTAQEYFGGIGAQSLMVREYFSPPIHYIGEWSPAAVRHLNRLHEKNSDVYVEKRDAYDPVTPVSHADLVLLDCGNGTAWRTREGQDFREMLDNVFKREPKAVVLTDIAARYLHLQRPRYETLLGEGSCESYETYLEAYLDRLQSLYGYSLATGYQDRWSAVMALVPDEEAPPHVKVLPTPDTPRGIEIF